MRYQTCATCGKKCRATLNMCPTCYPPHKPSKEGLTFAQAVRELPDSVDFDPLAMKTLNDLQWASAATRHGH